MSEVIIGQGDLLFYKNGTTLPEKVISWYTGSPFYHVAIAINSVTKIEALSTGIVIDGIDGRKPYSLWRYGEHSTDKDVQDMVAAVIWLRSMVGKQYGWTDIVTNINPIKKILYMASPLHYDCSALATVFLTKAGGVDLKGLELEPHSVTPSSLARALGIK